MNPRVFLDGYWRNDLQDEIFVAMSFDPRFRTRWERIFLPAVEQVQISGRQLGAVRVDIRKSGDSILSEIINGIAHSQMIVADISVVDRWRGPWLQRRAGRNANVMYEVGLAMACRQPVEVILVADVRDSEPFPFDVNSFPVTKFNPRDELGSVSLIRDLIIGRLNARKLELDLRVQGTLESLSGPEINLIQAAGDKDSWVWDSTASGVFFGVPLLLQKRLIRLVSVQPRQGPEGTVSKPTPGYTWTTLGRIVAAIISRENVGGHSPGTSSPNAIDREGS